MRTDMQDLQGALEEREELTAEGIVHKRIQKQMREQDKKRYRHPDADTPQISLVYVWRNDEWIPITWFRGNVTPHRVHRLRMRYRRKRSRATRGRIAAREIMRIVELRVARMQGGAGGAPISPIQAKTRVRGRVSGPHQISRLKTTFTGPHKTTNKTTNYRRKLTRTSGKLGRCDHTARGNRCTHRAFWFVGGLDMRKPFGKRRVTRRRCFKHAWDEKFLPPMKNVVRVWRGTQLRKAS